MSKQRSWQRFGTRKREILSKTTYIQFAYYSGFSSDNRATEYNFALPESLIKWNNWRFMFFGLTKVCPGWQRFDTSLGVDCKHCVHLIYSACKPRFLTSIFEKYIKVLCWCSVNLSFLDRDMRSKGAKFYYRNNWEIPQFHAERSKCLVSIS